MKILFLDDDLTRQRKAQANLIGHTVVTVSTAREAIEALKSRFTRYDIVSLDHDLGGQVMADSNDESGYAVADFIARAGKTYCGAVVVHSFNPVGGQRMMERLADVPGIQVVRALFGTPLYWQSITRADLAIVESAPQAPKPPEAEAAQDDPDNPRPPRVFKGVEWIHKSVGWDSRYTYFEGEKRRKKRRRRYLRHLSRANWRAILAAHNGNSADTWQAIADFLTPTMIEKNIPRELVSAMQRAE